MKSFVLLVVLGLTLCLAFSVDAKSAKKGKQMIVQFDLDYRLITVRAGPHGSSTETANVESSTYSYE